MQAGTSSHWMYIIVYMCCTASVIQYVFQNILGTYPIARSLALVCSASTSTWSYTFSLANNTCNFCLHFKNDDFDRNIYVCINDLYTFSYHEVSCLLYSMLVVLEVHAERHYYIVFSYRTTISIILAMCIRLCLLCF